MNLNNKTFKKIKELFQRTIQKRKIKKALNSVSFENILSENPLRYTRTLKFLNGEHITQITQIEKDKQGKFSAIIRLRQKEENKNLVGELTIVSNPNFLSKINFREKVFGINWINVELPYKKRGLLKQMLAECENIAKKEGVNTIALCPINTKAQRIYKKLGFIFLILDKKIAKSPGDLPIMIKKLN